MGEVSIVVPVYRGGEAFRSCLRHLCAVDPPPREIRVVADGSHAPDLEIAREFAVELMPIPGPGGPAGARNHGAGAASGELILFIDADVEVAPDIVERVQAAFDADPGLTALFGSYDDAPGDPGFISQFRNLLHHYVHQTGREEASTFWGCCGAIRRQEFLDAGGFDAGYGRPCIEDIELGVRLVSAGKRIRLAKDIQVKNLKRWTARTMVKSDIFDRAMPWTALILRSKSMPNDLNVDARGRASVAASTLLVVALLALPLHFWAMLATVVVCLIVVVVANFSFYAFLARRKGVWFAALAVEWHIVHYVCAAIGFGLGMLEHLRSGRGQASRLERERS